MGKKTPVRIQSSSLQTADMGGLDAHPSFLPTYPTWALVGGTSRPAGETVTIIYHKLEVQSIYYLHAKQEEKQKAKVLPIVCKKF